MSEAQCELIIGGVIASDRLQIPSAATAREQRLDAVLARDSLKLAQSRRAASHSEPVGARDLLKLSAARRVQVQEQVTVSDNVQAAQGSGQNHGEHARAKDRLHLRVHHRIELLDTLSATDSPQARQQASVTCLSAVFASDKLKSGQDATLYTAKTDSLAMSELVPEADINSLAVVQGDLAAAGREGLYRFSGSPAAPFIQSGALQPEGGYLWRAEACYLHHSGTPLTLHLTVSDGSAQTYHYTTEPRNASAPVPSKVKLGRGIRAHAFALGLSGEHFVLDGGALILNPLSRKH